MIGKIKRLLAWNDPNSKKRDPWGKNNDGPPDLDEIFRKLNNKLKGLFNISGGGDSNYYFVIWSLLIAAVLYALLGFYTVNENEQAVITRFGKYNRTVLSGLHWLPIMIERKDVVNWKQVKTSTHGGSMLTKDENVVDIEIKVQYRGGNSVVNYLFEVVDPAGSLKQAAESSLRQVVGRYDLDDILTDKKQQIQDDIETQIMKLIEDEYRTGLTIVQVNISKAKAPDQVKAAFDDVIRANEEKEQLKHQAEAYASKILPEAEGKARQLRTIANAYKGKVILAAEGETQRFNEVLPEYKKAPRVTKSRLYLDTLEHVFTKSSKIFVDLGKNGNNVLYLPIDRIGKNSNSVYELDKHAIDEQYKSDAKKELSDSLDAIRDTKGRG